MAGNPHVGILRSSSLTTSSPLNFPRIKLPSSPSFCSSTMLATCHKRATIEQHTLSPSPPPSTAVAQKAVINSLTTKNLKRLNSPSSQSSGTTTWVPSDFEWPRTIQYERTPTPPPPPDAEAPRRLEQPRSAKNLHTPEPHQCALGSKCIREIESLNYHRVKAIHLTARATQLKLHIRPDPDRFDDLEYIRKTCENIMDLLGRALVKSDPWAILKEIRSPEYWEAERNYLEHPGCLEQREKMSASTLSTATVPGGSAIEAGNLESVHEDGSSEGRLKPTRQNMSLASPAETNSSGRSTVGKELQARRPKPGRKSKGTASSPDISGDRGQKRKRKSAEEAAVDDDITPKKPCLDQPQQSIEGRDVSLDKASLLLQESRNLQRRDRQGKHAG